MPTYKISQLTTATAVSATNQFEINQNGTSKSVEVSVIDAYIKSTSNLPVVVSVSSASNALRITQTGTGNALVVEDSANPDATPFVVDSSGNVGIGTSSPGSKLEVNQGILTINTSDQSLTRLELKTTGTGGRTWDIVGGLPGVNNSQFSIYDVTAAATRMTIDSSGNVGINTASPGSALDVKGTLRLSGSTSGYVGLAPAAAAGSTTYTLPAADGSSGQVLSTNGSGTLSWASSGGGFAAGTAMLFVQTAAPTGWTKSTTHNNKALRIVSGTASSGGTVAFTTAFASQTPAGTIGSTTLSTNQIPSHTHTQGGTNQGASAGFSGCVGVISSANTGATGGGSSHNHTFTGTAIDLSVQYVDVIIATKD